MIDALKKEDAVACTHIAKDLNGQPPKKNTRTCRSVCVHCVKIVQQAGRPSLNYYVEWVITYAGSLSTVRMKIDYKQLWTQYMQCSCLQVLDYETLLCDRYIRTMN